jgi:hypothetical protein
LAWIITNTSHKKFNPPVPLTIHFKDGDGTTIKHVLEHGQSITMYFVPTSVKEMHIRNLVEMEFIENNRL